MQGELFSQAPRLDVAMYEAWPYPGLTARQTAQAALAGSDEFADVIADAVLTCASPASAAEVLAAIPQLWKKALEGYCHASLQPRQGEPRGIRVVRSATTLAYHHHRGR